MEYRLFKSWYTDRETRERRESDTWQIRFRDHLSRRQSLAASPRERDAHTMAGKLMELVRCRQVGEAPAEKLQKWIDTLSDGTRKRLVEMELIDQRAIDLGKPLVLHLSGEFDDKGTLKVPGYQQHAESKGGVAGNVRIRVDRVRRILDGCSLTFWRDLSNPGTATAVSVFLGKLRESGQIGGTSFNYYVRDVKSFCGWLFDHGRAPGLALTTLEPVENAATDSEQRRALSVAEMRLLLDACTAKRKSDDGKLIDPPMIQGMSGPERALLYRFAFETGMRPGQIRALLVKDFNLDAEPATVTTHAKYVKRRRTHTQAIRPALAGQLRDLFKSKMPAAPAIKMPSRFHMADMLRRDLADARVKWIDDANADHEERERRQRSDFLADVNHKGERAVFYSTRHGHGTALADAGVPEKDIAASMHHASRKTTARYLHGDRESVARAINAMPDLSYSEPAAATGTDCLSNAYATTTSPVDSGGQSDSAPLELKPLDSGPKSGKTALSGENQGSGLLAELADAMDSKSIARKGVSVRLR